MQYVISRNSSGRPTLQHAATGYRATQTLCGLGLSLWTRFWSSEPMQPMLCKKCAVIVERDQRSNVTPLRRRRTGTQG